MRAPQRHNARTRDERGQTTAEYALIMAIICGACIAAFVAFQNGVLMATFDRVNTLLSGM